MADMHTGSEGLVEPLTDREREILALMVEGHTGREIAERLFLSYGTVRWYNTRIYSKLGVSNRREAVEQAQLLGLRDVSLDDLAETQTRHNLPNQSTPFIGRQRELADLARLMADSDTQLLTILAPGGMGKTRLALAAAERQVRQFPDGVFLVPLAPLNSPDDIMSTIAENVGFSFYSGESPRKQLLDYFRQRNTLLVLDNFEHLLEGTPLVIDLLQAAPRVKVLATSREKLNLTGETIFTLSGLHFPNWETPEDALEYDAIKLFMQSARRVRPDFELQTGDLTFLARICRLTAGMPLGIVLAAGWVDVLSLEQIAAEIQQGFDILETEMRDVPERQGSVRASFNYSWNRLTNDEQDVFMKLSVFRGGFTPEAAASVVGADRRALRRLVSKALVQASPDGRYDIHELLRQFAEARLLEAGEAEVVQQAHSTYYLGFMAERDTDIKGRRQQAGLEEIRADFENIRQGWLWAAEHRQHDAISRAALDCLVNFAEMGFSALEAKVMLGQTVTALQPAAGELPHPAWDQAVVRRERVNLIRNDQVKYELVERVLARAHQRSDEHEIAYCLWVLGDYAFAIGNFESHQVYYEECLALWRSVGDAFYIAQAFIGIHSVYARRGEIGHRNECLRESARIRREIGDHSNLCFTLGGLGHYLSLDGNFAEADMLLDEALAIQAHIGRTHLNMGIAIFKAMLAFWRGDLETTVRQLQAWEEYAERRDIAFRKAYLALLSWIASVGGNCQRGYDLNLQAAPDNLSWVALSVWWGLALAQCGLGNHKAAWRWLWDTLNCARDDLKSPTYQQLCLPPVAVLAARAGNAERAVELLGLAYSAPRELTGWMAHWQLLTDVQRDLEAELGAEAYTAAWERGAQLDLETVVEELLAEFANAEGK